MRYPISLKYVFQQFVFIQVNTSQHHAEPSTPRLLDIDLECGEER
jgi:hypothetical protein